MGTTGTTGADEGAMTPAEAMSDMPPCFSGSYQPDSVFVHMEADRDTSPAFSIGYPPSYFQRIRLDKFGHDVFGSSRRAKPKKTNCAPLVFHVSHVLGARTCKQVSRVAALPVIAPMANMKMSRVSVDGDVSKSVGPVPALASVEAPVPVGIDVRRPLPALVGSTSLDLVPKTCDYFFVHESPLLGLTPDVCASRGRLDRSVA
jgi:hypothetical protein